MALLEELPPGPELAMAYSNRAQLRMLDGDTPAAVEWGGRAIELAERLGETETLVHALNNVGTARRTAGDDGGTRDLERSLALGRAAGLEEHVARALTNLASTSVADRRHAAADRYLREGIDYATEHDLDAWGLYMLGWRAQFELQQGRWAEAAETAARVLARPHGAPILRINALTVLARVRARRGDPGVEPLLAEALELAVGIGEVQRLLPVAAARAEAAWLGGDPSIIGEAVGETFQLAQDRRDAWALGELGWWLWRAGRVDAPPPGAAEPYALHIAGRYGAAAARWEELGCPYEAALALADSGDEAHLRRALAALEQLGARIDAAAVTRRLRQRGVRALPRGPRPATRANPANLTPRELEVARLVAEGLPDAEIGRRLFISVKTAGHHVSAILAKLGVRSRAEVGRAAERLGIDAREGGERPPPT